MKNAAVTRTPLAAFTLPPHPPADVAKANATFDRLGDEWGRTKGELEDARRAVVEADAADIREAADAFAAGRKVVDPGKREREASAKIAPLQKKLEALSIALDEAGNALANSIGKARGEYADNNRSRSSATAAEIDAAIAVLRDALPRYGAAVAAVAWVERFEVGLAHVGQQPQFAGGKATVDMTAVPRDANTPALVLVDQLATITAKPQLEQPRRHRVAVR